MTLTDTAFDRLKASPTKPSADFVRPIDRLEGVNQATTLGYWIGWVLTGAGLLVAVLNLA